MRDRDLPPGKVLEPGEQVRLVAFDRDQVMRAAAVKVFGVVPLSVQGIGGDHSVPDVYRVQQHAEPGDFIGLRAHFDLAQHRAVSVVERSEQVVGILAAAAGAAYGLAVHRDNPAPARHGCGALSRP
jgi:hypothetical protein